MDNKQVNMLYYAIRGIESNLEGNLTRLSQSQAVFLLQNIKANCSGIVEWLTSIIEEINEEERL